MIERFETPNLIIKCCTYSGAFFQFPFIRIDPLTRLNNFDKKSWLILILTFFFCTENLLKLIGFVKKTESSKLQFYFLFSDESENPARNMAILQQGKFLFIS